MIVDKKSELRQLFIRRSVAYQNVFDLKSPYTHAVLKDLAKFCRAHESTFNADPRAHAILEGRREVWLRIQEYLNLNGDELFALHRVKELVQGEKK